MQDTTNSTTTTTTTTTTAQNNIVFIDLQATEEAERARLRNRQFQINLASKANQGPLPPDIQDELEATSVALALVSYPIPVTVDPLFAAVQEDLQRSGQIVADHQQGVLAQLDSAGIMLAAIFGIVERDNLAAPGLGNLPASVKDVSELPADDQTFFDKGRGWLPGTQPPPLPADSAAAGEAGVASASTGQAGAARQLRNFLLRRLPRDVSFESADTARRFSDATSKARSEYLFNQTLYDRVLQILASEGTELPNGLAGLTLPVGLVVAAPDTRPQVSPQQWAQVVKALIQQRISADDFQLQSKVRAVLDSFAVGGSDSPSLAVAIDLPDLDGEVDNEIVADNLHALQAVYFSAQLEQMKFFRVFDKLGELAQNGYLPIGRGRAGDILFAAYRKNSNRLSEYERHGLYARTLGLPGGDPGQGQPNREFNDLWLRFLSAVSSFVRQFTLDNLLRATIAGAVTQEQVRKAGRDLAVNLSAHGYGLTFQFATQLQDQINEGVSLMSDTDIKSAYGARDMFQVIDQVSQLELNGQANTTRYRTMAQAGAVVIRWLANHAPQLQGPTGTPIIDMDAVRRPGPRTPHTRPTTAPTDADLVNACDQWLAVTGTSDARVEEFSQPVDSPAMSSRPIAIPSVARDLLESVGVGTNGNR